MKSRTAVLTTTLMAALLLCPTARADEREEHEGQGATRLLTERDARAGKPLYIRECSACHGERGAGNGPAAEHLNPRPRNFTNRVFKLRMTASGQPPTTADVLRVIERGIPGSAMPSFAFLPEGERKQIAAYVLELADFLEGPEPKVMPAPASPPPATAESVAHGKSLYQDLECFSCHGQLGKGDGPSAPKLKDTEGRPILARDLTTGIYRGGGERIDLYYRISTGMDGSPMPSFADSLEDPDRWALVDYVLSLRAPEAAKTRPSDPLAAGREVIAKYNCQGCHVLDDGTGGEVGPDFRLAGQKLIPGWTRKFLKAPREVGKIYPWRPWRMPDLRLSDEEVQVMTKYLATLGKKSDQPAALPDVSKFPLARVDEGKNLFGIVCAQCHALGKVIETPVAAQLGPDLINASARVDFEWEKKWVSDPKKIDPKTRMTISPLTPEQVDGVRMFVWKTSMEAKAAAVAENR